MKSLPKTRPKTTSVSATRPATIHRTGSGARRADLTGFRRCCMDRVRRAAHALALPALHRRVVQHDHLVDERGAILPDDVDLDILRHLPALRMRLGADEPRVAA